MKKILTITATSLMLLSTGASAQWGGMPFGGGSGSNMMPFGGGTGSNMMPWSGQQGYSQPRYAQPQSPFGSMMPFGQTQAPVYQQPQSQMFGGMPFGSSGSGMMPWGGSSAPSYRAPQSNGFGSMMPWGGMSQPQYQQPKSQGFMMPGMDQGIRSMMQPGKIMAEEATPGMYMKPTWR